MKALSKLRNLRVLNLNNTAISDAGLSQISTLDELRSLSVVGTRVTDASIETLTKIKNLTHLFLYQTAISDAGLQKLMKEHEKMKIDTGNYTLEKLPTDTIVYKQTSRK
jgi:Leucine-rich repeat (LRR) protein